MSRWFKARYLRLGDPQVTEELLQAASEAALRQTLAAQGFTVLGVSALAGSASPPSIRKGAQRGRFALFCREVSTLIQAGMTVVEAVDTLSARERLAGRQESLAAELLARLEQGTSLSNALAQLPDAPPVLVAAVRAGERTSDLAQALSDYLKFDTLVEQLRRKVVSAAIYPALVTTLGVGISLFLLLVTYLDRYVSIRDSKHNATRNKLVANHALIMQRYLDHAQAVALSTLGSLQPNAQALQISEPLRACYGVATQPLKELKLALKAAQPARRLKYCPMCGTTLPRTFDHYIPAVRFPEFAVHPLNLVPCCSICNSTKDDDWLCAAGQRQYLHAYTDPLPVDQFVNVMLHKDPALQGVGATFSLSRPAGVPDALWRLIESHFRKLKLIERFNERSNDEVSEILSDCRSFVVAGGQDARTFLSLQADDRAAVYGRNHWIAVLMAAMAVHADFDVWVTPN